MLTAIRLLVFRIKEKLIIRKFHKWRKKKVSQRRVGIGKTTGARQSIAVASYWSSVANCYKPDERTTAKRRIRAIVRESQADWPGKNEFYV